MHAWHIYHFRFYPGFLSSHELCKYQYEYISSGELCLLDFLLSENALFYFMEVRQGTAFAWSWETGHVLFVNALTNARMW